MENSVLFARKKIEMENFLSQAKISTQNAVQKIISTSARAYVSLAECMGGSLTVSGKAFVNVVYLSTENTVERASAEVDFIEKQASNMALENAFGLDEVSVESVNFSSSEVMVSLSHKAEVCGIFKYEMPSFDDEKNNFVIAKKSFACTRLVSSGLDSFSVAEEVENSMTNLQILNADASVIISDANCTLDKTVLEGKVICNALVYDGESFVNLSKEFEFKQEVLMEGVTPNMFADASCYVKNISLNVAENENKTTLSYGFDVEAQVLAFEEATVEAASDMFSLSNEIATKYEYIEAKNYNSFVTSGEEITVSADIADVENLDDVLAVYGAKISLISVNDIGVKADVYAKISYDALALVGGEYQTLSFENEESFEVIKDENTTLDDVSLAANVSSFKVKAGKEIEITINASYTAKFCTKLSESFVSSFENIKEKTAENGGVKVYVAKCGETLFDVAKALSVRPEIISKQNDSKEVFEQGEKIYVYNQINLI